MQTNIDRSVGTTGVYRDRQGKPVLIALTVLILVCGVIGVLAGVLSS